MTPDITRRAVIPAVAAPAILTSTTATATAAAPGARTIHELLAPENSFLLLVD